MTASTTAKKPSPADKGSGQTETTAGEPDRRAKPVDDAVSTAKKHAAETIQNVKDDVGTRAEAGKETIADEVSDVASALRKAADDMRDGSPQERTMAQIADGFADASEAIRGKDLGQMIEGANQFARNNPVAFLGAAALVGFAASRFGKASSVAGTSSAAGNAHRSRSAAQSANTEGRIPTPTPHRVQDEARGEHS